MFETPDLRSIAPKGLRNVLKMKEEIPAGLYGVIAFLLACHYRESRLLNNGKNVQEVQHSMVAGYEAVIFLLVKSEHQSRICQAL